MATPMVPDWKDYLAAFQSFQNESKSKYRAVSINTKDEGEKSSRTTESLAAEGTPVKPPSGAQVTILNVSMGTASTAFTSPNQGNLSTGPADTCPSSISSEASKRSENVVNELNNSEGTVNDLKETENPFDPGSVEPQSSLPRTVMSELVEEGEKSTREQCTSGNLSTSTMDLKFSKQLEPEDSKSEQSQPSEPIYQAENASPSKRESDNGMDSDGSDEIVFRQDEHNMVGPRLYPGKQFTEQEKRAFPIAGQMNNSKEAPKPELTRPSPNTKAQKNAAPKEATIEDKRAKLQRLQEAELLKIRRKQLGLDETQAKDSLLHLARQGPGADPESEITRGIRNLVLAAPQQATLTPPPLGSGNRQQCGLSGVELVAANSALTEGHRETGVELREVSAFQPVLIDWQYRPWQAYGDDWTKRFGDWLEYTMRLGCVVDTHSGPFTNPDLHPDGVSGFVEFDIQEPVVDTSIAESAHAHETAAGYIYNWNLRIEQDKAKELQKKQLSIAHMKAMAKVKPEPHPFAPKTNLYLRPVEPKDIPGLTSLYNWYIKNSVRCIELDEKSPDQMRLCVNQSEAAGLPCLIAAEHKPGRGYAMNSEKETVYGFIIAKDFSGIRTANRYTAELELFVNPTQYNRRVGRSLLDKMLELCDPRYTPKRGYTFDCAAPGRSLYCGADVRPLSRLVIVFHYSADDANEYQWFKTWMTEEFGFAEQGVLQGTAVKNCKVLSSGYLVRNTTLKPETKGDTEIVRWRFG
ncbi:conserved hypothetical protein [Uncinocarpus reesii 1704]|uniref:N-acetyltransferase domain-containing protein n=1 Tax=Uncinocarpus reesii (strain UAMH 1704) TaxID=336963 RepID=C4JY80_UNCRE|nr:uncharacterized protein UREG_07131 [Uncinocarpus reesii 1704]EEP82266.1 conserved hypothetical protein [Uncinocarpus reesii 1704]